MHPKRYMSGVYLKQRATDCQLLKYVCGFWHFKFIKGEKIKKVINI